ncbi:MAG: sulfatase [Promethearchaeota archaeon]|jgi:arylsulfatase A-like enzyme
MKVIFILFDTLNKHFLPPYRNNWVHAPNFKRLAEKTVIFDNCYCGSLMCIPARRELHTGRYNFLHRSWGPMEPFDDSMPEILKNNGVYSHLISDHYHYWEDGGCTYHNRYSSWEIVRGHEGDPWKGEVRDPKIPETVPNWRRNLPHWRQDWVNRKYMQKEEDQPQAGTFKLAFEFIEKNHMEDNWFLHVETFDPHEPYFTQQKYKNIYKHDYNGPHFDWPNYGIVTETEEQVQHVRKEYAASVSMCDTYLGKILDILDEKDMWKDTMLIITTDHGFLLGEKDWWAKGVQPIYNEIAQIPLFIWDPRTGKKNQRREALVQTTDIVPTILEFFGIECTNDMQGSVLKETINSDAKIREYGLFGTHGAHVNITDGRYIYMRAPTNPFNKPLYDYTLMPTHMRGFFSINELRTVELADPFSFTKGIKLIRTDTRLRYVNPYIFGSLLFDLHDDPNQEHPIINAEIEKKMIKALIKEMKRNQSPVEQFERLGIPYDGEITNSHLDLIENRSGVKDKIGDTEVVWNKKGKSMYSLIMGYVPSRFQKPTSLQIEQEIKKRSTNEIDEDFLVEVFERILPKNYIPLVRNMTKLVKIKGK